MRSFKKIGWVLFGTGLFLLFWIGLLLAAQGKPFWMDESDGWHRVTYISILELIKDGGPLGQASRSPLPFLVDRIIMKLANDHPQSMWDLRLFYRIPPAFFWAIANVFLFFFLRKKFARLLPNKDFLVFIAALTGSFFVFTNSFSAYYAIEARSYSIWTAITLFQTCMLWSLLTEKYNKTNFVGFLLSNYLLVFATYAASLQVALACGILLLHDRFKEKKWRFFAAPQKWVLATALGSMFITFYYYASVQKMAYNPIPFGFYVYSVMEVILKSFRHHSYHPAWVSFPVLFLLIPWYWWKKDRSIALLCLNAHVSILLTYLHYRASLAVGGLYASRYAAYLVPSLSFLYGVGVFTLLLQLSLWIKKKWKKDYLYPIIILYCLVNVIPWIYKYSKGIPADIARFKARNSYQENLDFRCVSKLVHDPEELEAQNDFCRRL